MHTIGVIVTVYNKEAYVGRALHSLLKQQLSPDQLIVVNDKSTDNSEKIIKDFMIRLRVGIQEVLYLSLEKNLGAAGARNEALKLIHTDFVVFLDADDQYETDYIQRLKSLLKDDIGMIASKVRMESNAITYPSDKVLPTLRESVGSYHVVEPFTTMAIESLFIGGGNLCFKRSLMPEEWFLIHESNFEEWDFYYRTLKNVLVNGFEFIYNPVVGYIYNDLDQQSLSRKYVQKAGQIKIPALIERVKDKSESKYKGLLVSIWYYNSLTRLKSFRQKFRFMIINWKMLGVMPLNRYSMGSILQFIASEKFINKLKNRYKKKRYQ